MACNLKTKRQGKKLTLLSNGQRCKWAVVNQRKNEPQNLHTVVLNKNESAHLSKMEEMCDLWKRRRGILSRWEMKMSPNFWENTTSQEQINEAEAKLQLSAAELLKEEQENLWTGAGLPKNWRLLHQIANWITRRFTWLLYQCFKGSYAWNFTILTCIYDTEYIQYVNGI